MDENTRVKKKLVTVRCAQPFAYNKISFVGICNKVVLDVETIRYALGCKALISEHLKNGTLVPLGFDNYDTWNGPTIVDDNTDTLAYETQEIEMIDGFGNRKVINKTNAKKETKPIIHIDLEAQKRQAEEEAKRKKLEEIENQKRQAEEEKARIKAEQQERDRIAREKAMEEILARAQAEADKAVSVDEEKKSETKETKYIPFVADFQATVTAESDDDESYIN